MSMQNQRVDRSIPIWFGRIRLELQRLALPVLEKKRGGLLSVTLQAPLPISTLLPETGESRHYWYRPAEELKLVGLGVARELVAEGEDRFQELRHKYRGLQNDWTHIAHGKTVSSARAFLGYAFDPLQKEVPIWKDFPNSRLTIPALLVEWRDGSCNLTFSYCQDRELAPPRVLVEWLELLNSLLHQHRDPDERPSLEGVSSGLLSDQEEWQGQVRKIKADIAAGKVSKVVLGRCLKVTAKRNFNLNNLLRELADSFPGCSVIATNAGNATLVAATPERLVSVNSGNLQSDALAGTFDISDDLPLNGMRQFEHAPVVSSIRSALLPLCDDLKTAESPVSMKLGSLQHLWTRVTGRLKSRVTLFDLIEQLHPTPAVGGMPRQAALDWIRAYDNTPRGWYTGGFGWLGACDEGEISVVLRCALLARDHADLFAGAGITAISDPAREYLETQWKFSAILGALQRAR